jgi:hypothetical protein
MLSITSRYRDIEQAALVGDDGRRTPYLRRRFLPTVVDLTVFAEHSVAEGERLDNLTAQYLGDPELFWRVCDANDAMHPLELTAAIGRRLRIPLVEGG